MANNKDTSKTVTWEVEAQVEGGRVERGRVNAPADTTRNYVLQKFLALHITNPGRRQFWYYQNAGRAKVKAAARQDLDNELPAPGYLEWPAVWK